VVRWISEQSAFVIGRYARLDMSVLCAYLVFSSFKFATNLTVFCQRYERCSTCGTVFGDPGETA